MTGSDYIDRLRRNYANVVATLALVVALTGVGAWAGTVLVGSKQIRNGSILTQDIRKGAVKTSDIGGSAVTSPDIASGTVQGIDIGDGQVTPTDVTMPDPDQIQDADTAVGQVGPEAFALVDTVGSYAKEDPASILEVDWTGTANAPETSCVFQLRVDGQPSAGGGGLVYVANVGAESTTSISVAALFEGLPVGAHTIEVWARSKTSAGSTSPCIVGPAVAGLPQTFVVSEQVV